MRSSQGHAQSRISITENTVGIFQNVGTQALVEDRTCDGRLSLAHFQMRQQLRRSAGDPAQAQSRRAVGLGQRRDRQHALGQCGAGLRRRVIAITRLPKCFIHQQIGIRRACRHNIENGCHEVGTDGDARWVVRRNQQHQLGALVEQRCEALDVDPVAVIKVQVQRYFHRSQRLNEIECGGKARRHGDDFITLIAQAENCQVQCTDGAVGCQNVIGMQADILCDGDAQPVIARRRAVAGALSTNFGYQCIIENLAEAKIVRRASAQVIAVLGLLQYVGGRVKNLAHVATPISRRIRRQAKVNPFRRRRRL